MFYISSLVEETHHWSIKNCTRIFPLNKNDKKSTEVNFCLKDNVAPPIKNSLYLAPTYTHQRELCCSGHKKYIEGGQIDSTFSRRHCVAPL